MVSTSPLPSSKNGWKAAPVRTFEGHENAIFSVAWYPDERRIVSASYDGELRIWDTETSSQVGEAIRGHVRSVWTLYVSPDGTMIASGGRDTTVRLWHSETGAPIHICEGHKDAIRDVHFSPDSTRVVSVSQDHTMRIWDVKTGELVCEPVKCKGGPVYAVRYSPKR